MAVVRICNVGILWPSLFEMGIVTVILGIIHWYRIYVIEVQTNRRWEVAVSRRSNTVVVFTPPLLSPHFCLVLVVADFSREV